MSDYLVHTDIIELCKQGDRKAQYQLYSKYSKAMYNVCLRMMRDEMEAEDVLQNAFIDVFVKLDSYRYESSIGAWIRRIVVNHCINQLKKLQRFRVEDLDDRHDMAATDGSDIESSWLSVDMVREALHKLPEGYRTVFSLYAMEGYDHGEIAEILDITETTSKSQYHRAKLKLREVIQEDYTSMLS